MKTLILLLSLTGSIAQACLVDSECGWNGQCMRSGRFGEAGYCAKVEQANSYQQPSHVVQKTCKSQYECGYGERCSIPYGQSWGVCN